MSKFERKFGKYAIKYLPFILIVFYAVGYVIQLLVPEAILYLSLNPYAICKGQIWRVISWLFIPPNESNIIFTLIMLYFYCSIGTTLERTWGTYRFNVYIFGGILFTVIGSFLLMGFSYLFLTESISLYGVETFFQLLSLRFSTYYVNMSIFLAFAATFPDNRVLLFFIIPIKVKWLGIAYGVLLLFSVLTGDVGTRFAIIASLLNFVVFFLTSRNTIHMNPKEIKRKYDYKKETKMPSGITKHKCAICGRTDESDPSMMFRFCSKCEGNYEYCEEHIYTHTHVKIGGNNG